MTHMKNKKHVTVFLFMQSWWIFNTSMWTAKLYKVIHQKCKVSYQDFGF